jgi:hypothetical protein
MVRVRLAAFFPIPILPAILACAEALPPAEDCLTPCQGPDSPLDCMARAELCRAADGLRLKPGGLLVVPAGPPPSGVVLVLRNTAAAAAAVPLRVVGLDLAEEQPQLAPAFACLAGAHDGPCRPESLASIVPLGLDLRCGQVREERLVIRPTPEASFGRSAILRLWMEHDPFFSPKFGSPYWLRLLIGAPR